MTETSARERAPLVRAHGANIPAVGFGTWELTGATARRMTAVALEAGYRHVDTAQAYGNEEEIGRALEASDVPREEIFLTTKVWPDSYAPGDFRAAVDRSLERLRIDHVDLLLLHWPRFGRTSLERTVELLEEARTAGRTRHVGVSNFTAELLQRARKACSAPLVTDQVEYHPFLDQSALLEALREHGMALTAYSPLAHGRAPGDETLAEIGRRHGATAAQVALAWLIRQPGVAAVPRTSEPDHCRENLGAVELELSAEEMRRIGGLAEPDGRVIDPAGLAPDWD